MYTHTPSPDLFFIFPSTCPVLTNCIRQFRPQRSLHLNLAKILKLLRLHTSFNPLNYSLQSNALLSSNIVHSSVPRLLLISDNYFHGLLKARSHERLSCGCQLEYLISYFDLHHVVSLGSFADSLTLIGLSFSRLRCFLPRCPLLGASKLRLLRVSHSCLDKGWCISP